MKDNVRSLALDEIPPGATLAEDVFDAAGNLLLRAGLMLTEEIIDKMSRRGIEAMPVEMENEDVGEKDDDLRREVLEQRLKYLFRHAGDTPASRDLMEQVLEYRWNQKA